MLDKIKKNLIGIKQSYAFMERFDIDLSLSENPLGCSLKVFAVIKKNMDKVKHYPDPRCMELRKALSKKSGVPIEKIVIANGSEQLIDLIPRVLLSPGNEVIIPEVTFPLFEKKAIITSARPVFSKMSSDFSINLKDIKNRITKETKLIFLCNPNNPTGKILEKKKILEFIEIVQPISVVMDEANIEFGGKSVVKEINKFNNLIVLRTFSKAFGLAGLRIGVCFAPKNLVKLLDKIRQPFAVNALAQKCAIAALEDNDFIRKTKKFMESQREFLIKELKKRGFKVIDSQSNNILVKVDKFFESSTRFIDLLKKNNISVVDGTNFRGLGNKFIRISPRLPEVNRKFIKIVDKLLK